MKRKKVPFVLLSVLVLLGGFMAMWNALSSGLLKLPERRPQAPQAPAQATSAAELKEQYKRGSKPNAQPGPAEAGATERKNPVPPEEREMAQPKQGKPEKFVPKPSETSTSSQWY